MKLVDMFCGGGTLASVFSEAGCEVVGGVDCDEVALETFRRNFPDATVCCRRLPLSFSDLGLPPLCENTHLHFSPPCTAISSARRGATAAEREHGVLLLAWSIEMALALRPASWSVEDVDVKESRAVAEHYKRLYPDLVDMVRTPTPTSTTHKLTCGVSFSGALVSLDAASFGCPQRRVRLLVVPPRMKDMLVRQADGRSTSIKEAFEREGVRLPSGHVRAMASLSSDPTARCVRTVNEKSFAVVASRAGSFCDATGKTLVESFSPVHTRILMSLSPRFELPDNRKRAQRILGNGIAGPVSAAIVAAAGEMERQNPPVFGPEEARAIHEVALARARDVARHVATRPSEMLAHPRKRGSNDERQEYDQIKKLRLPVLAPGASTTLVVPAGHSLWKLKEGEKGTYFCLCNDAESEDEG